MKKTSSQKAQKSSFVNFNVKIKINFTVRVSPILGDSGSDDEIEPFVTRCGIPPFDFVNACQ